MGGRPSLVRALAARWRDARGRHGATAALRELAADLWEFLKESTPARRLSRYGDIEYDFEQRVDTTAATVGSRDRLLGAVAGGPYQPVDPELLRANLEALPLRHQSTRSSISARAKGGRCWWPPNSITAGS